jgi:hypothetical protein
MDGWRKGGREGGRKRKQKKRKEPNRPTYLPHVPVEVVHAKVRGDLVAHVLLEVLRVVLAVEGLRDEQVSVGCLSRKGCVWAGGGGDAG